VLPEGIRRLFHLARSPHGVAADVDLEIQHHFAAAIDGLVQRGMSPEEARATAERRFGDVRRMREELIALSRSRADRRRRFEWRSDWWLDVRQAVRGYTSTPGVTLAILTMLALGVGANTAMYGILDKLFIQPPPHINGPDGILRLYARERSGFTGGEEITHSQFDLEQYAALARDVPAFAALAGYWGPSRETSGHGQQAEQLRTQTVTGNYFEFLGVQPGRGRLLEPADDDPTAAPAAVISYGYWQRRFGGSDAALGRVLDVGGTTYTVVGVAPRGFSGATANAADIWVPAEIAGAAQGPHWRQRYWGGLPLRALARLRRGVTPTVAAEQAAAVLRAHYETTLLPTGDRPPPLGALRVFTGSLMDAFGPEGLSEGLRLSLLVGGVALILLAIACANVANLLMLRAATRRRELAVRSALGAGRWRVARMLLIESTVLALAAGMAAIGVAAVTGRVLRVVLVPSMQWATGVVDLRVLLFASAVALALGLLAGVVPALQARRGAGVDDLRAGVRAARRGSTPVRAGLLITQGALALVLVVGAGVFYRSLEAARRHDAGLDLERLLVVNLNPTALNPVDSPSLVEERVAAIDERLRRLPGVVDVAQVSHMAAMEWTRMALRVRGIESLPRMPGPYIRGVTPNFFRVAGLATTRGRGLGDSDAKGAPRVALVNTVMARALWPSGDPIGACLYVGDPNECTTVVGVVETERASVRMGEAVAQYYVPLAQYPRPLNSRSLLVRARDKPQQLVQPTLRAMAGLFPDLPRDRVVVLGQSYGRELRPWKVGMGLFGAAAGLALLVAAVGLYAVIAYGVRQREHEFGIRRALGAQVSDITRLVMTQSVSFAVLGAALGVALAYWGARFVTPLLHRDVSGRDPLVLVVAGGVLLAACLLAGLFPARGAARADPRAALQAE
jgi:predicted permease